MYRVCVIGGGAAGMAAAMFAAERGAEVDLFEKNEKLGKKLFITGKGRCNFTNDCEPETLFSNVVTNSRFLYSAFGGWNSQQTIRLFESLGVRTKVERGRRAFPASDHSSDIICALEARLRALHVRVHLRTGVRELILKDLPEEKTATADGWGSSGKYGKRAGKKRNRGPEKIVRGLVTMSGEKVYADAVVIATGGLSYPSTGSTGDGYRFAEDAGHTVTSMRPALVGLVTKENYIPRLQGLSLRNVTLTIPYGKKKKYSDFGEMLFTHEGISGPLALSASSWIGKSLEDRPLPATVDLKPALSMEQLDARILREFDAAKNKEFKNAAAPLFPAKLRPVMTELSGIPEDKKVNEITREERAHFAALIKAFPFTITGHGGYKEAVITQGGVNVKEIDPSTMESKRTAGLFFAGEVMDLDALTGGFNLQIAWATAHSAARGIAKAALTDE